MTVSRTLTCPPCRAVLITPASRPARRNELTGVDVHRLLVDRLTELGLRAPQRAPVGSAEAS